MDELRSLIKANDSYKISVSTKISARHSRLQLWRTNGRDVNGKIYTNEQLETTTCLLHAHCRQAIL